MIIIKSHYNKYQILESNITRPHYIVIKYDNVTLYSKVYQLQTTSLNQNIS